MRRRAAAYAVHAFTASGIFLALLAILEVTAPVPDPRWVFAWLGLAIVVDAVDGPLARAVHVERYAPQIDGSKIDDLVDYITYTFIPLVLVLRMGWAQPYWAAWCAAAAAMLASLFGFAHRGAKDEEGGFFRGFPSYWNLLAYYFGLWAVYYGALGGMLVTASLLALAVLTVLPVRFLYPNRAPRPVKAPLMAGAFLWGALLVGMLPWYPSPADPDGGIPPALMWLSLAYPAAYAAASLSLARQRGKGARNRAE